MSINEGPTELHGEWLLVTRRKKPSHGQPSNNNKNRFSPLTTAHQNKPTNLPSKPNPHEIPRASKTNYEAKRRRQDTDCDASTLKSLTIIPKTNHEGTKKYLNHKTNHGPIIDHVSSAATGPTKNHQSEISNTPLPPIQSSTKSPNQQVINKNAITNTSSTTRREHTSTNNEPPSNTELEDETMFGTDTVEPNQVNTEPTEGYHETSSDSKEDMVT